MNKVKELDTTLYSLYKKTNNGSLVTIEDLYKYTKIERPQLLRILEYLAKSNYCEKVSNAYRINFEGEYLINRTLFMFKKRPFLYENTYKKLKFIAFIFNTLFILTLGLLNYQMNKEKKDRTIETEKRKYNENKNPTQKGDTILINHHKLWKQ